MKRLFSFVLIIVLLFSSCSAKNADENIPEEQKPLPHLFINGTYYYTYPDFEACEAPDDEYISEEKLAYRKTGNIRKLGEGEGNFIECEGQPYAFINDVLYVSVRIEDSDSVYFRWVEMYPVGEISSSETARRNSSESSSNCVPSVPDNRKNNSSEPSHYHSTDTSSNISQQSAFSDKSQNGIITSSAPEYLSSGTSAETSATYYFKGRVINSLPEYSDLPSAALGNESVLERWYSAIADISDVSEILVQSASADKRELHFDETSAVIEELRSINLTIKPKMDNPATGGSVTVAAFSSEENELWRVTLDGYLFVLSFGGENASYIFDMSGQDYSQIIGIVSYVSSMSQP